MATPGRLASKTSIVIQLLAGPSAAAICFNAERVGHSAVLRLLYCFSHCAGLHARGASADGSILVTPLSNETQERAVACPNFLYSCMFCFGCGQFVNRSDCSYPNLTTRTACCAKPGHHSTGSDPFATSTTYLPNGF